MRTQTTLRWVFVLITLMLLIPFNELMAQEQKEENPKIEIKVNKHKDEKGNIIQYDSSYSYSWKGEEMPPAFIDSVLQNFKMNRNLPDFFEDEFFDQDFFKGFDLEGFFNGDAFGERFDSLKPGIYDRFDSDPFNRFSDFDQLHEMMKKRQERMMEYFEQFKNSHDSTLEIKPEIRKQNNTAPVLKGKVIKT